ncbi:MAG: heavy-metal-associated domain-containing protein [Deltaproteobacteria bacterium]|nr:heavy-metal-associated domain-containing protein [Deltaproteobacteria bacterium]
MIVSLTHGRIRARLTHLRGQEAPDIPVGAIKGVKNVTINPMTGSVLLEYDPDLIGLGDIAEFLEPFDPEGAATLRNPGLLKPRSVFPRPVEVPIELVTDDERPQVLARRHRERPRGSAAATHETLNLTVGFLSVVFSAFWGSMRAHTILGASFGIMLGQHVWKHRRRLRPLHQMSWMEILGIEIPGFLRPAPPEPPELLEPPHEDDPDPVIEASLADGQGPPEGQPTH